MPSGRSAPAGHIIRLGPLGDGDTIGLLATLPHHHGLPAVGPALDAAVGGNPLFAEEYVRMVRDHPIPGAGGVGLPLPESVHAIIAARLEALPAEEKAALQDLSCWAGSAGWATWQRSAAAAGPRPFLERMAAREFLYWAGRPSMAGEREYGFLHVVVCEVAYGQIPWLERADRHRRAAASLESLAAERSVLLAHDYGRALEAAGKRTRQVAAESLWSADSVKVASP